MKRIYGLIRKLGATSKYKGYFFVAEAVKISMRHQYKPMHITKDIYPCLATKYKSTPTNIEHDIRTLINVCWEGNKSFLDEIAGYPCILFERNGRRELITVFQKVSDSGSENGESYHPRTVPAVWSLKMF